MKNKIALATAAMVAGSSLATAEIVINDFLSFEGFVDMSYTHTDAELDGESDNESSFQIDQVEISWLFNFDPVTAQIDLEYEDTSGVSDTEVEQAFATYHFDNGGAITAGRYASMLGFEAFEPTGLYQYSYAYDVLAGDVSVLPGYAQGVKFTYETDTTFFGISLQDEAFDTGNDQLGGNNGTSSYAVEIAGSAQLGNGVAVFLGGVYEDSEVVDSDSYAINAYITLESGAWLFAGEMNYGNFEGGQVLSAVAAANEEEDVFQALAMANFAYSEAASVTGRISYSDHELDNGGSADFVKFTLAHGYAFTDNLFLVNEISYVDGDIEGADLEGLQGAVELIFSF